jgi:16S rRNA (cytosine1402-N4)-methyltransferase
VDFHHISVLKDEVIESLVTNRDGIYVDCTLGGAGHSLAIAELLSDKGRIVGIDQDSTAISVAKERLQGARCRVDIVHDNFSNLNDILAGLNIDFIDGILFDLGVSSHQLDTAERGFSYMHDGALDMRMNQDSGLSAYDVVNGYSEEDLARIIFEYGEERWSKRIAKFIAETRNEAAIKTTGELVDVIKRAIPAAARKDGGHPAKRTFQAIRIEVNNELGILRDAFKTAVEHLKTQGRISIITFHSLEDRIAKKTLQELAKGCICPPRIPVCVCNNKPKIKILGRKSATPAELADNSRAKSAKLRTAVKI